jgi:hypothetical protein
MNFLSTCVGNRKLKLAMVISFIESKQYLRLISAVFRPRWLYSGYKYEQDIGRMKCKTGITTSRHLSQNICKIGNPTQHING